MNPLPLSISTSSATAFSHSNEVFATRNDLLEQALNFIRNKKYTEAAHLLNWLRDYRPADPASWRLLGVVHHLCGRYQTAIELTQKAISLGDISTENYVNLAVSAESLGEIKIARYAYTEALKIDSELSHVRLELCLSQLSDIPENMETANAMLGHWSDSLEDLNWWLSGASIRKKSLAQYVDLTAPFLLAYQPGNHAKSLGLYGELVTTAMQALEPRQLTKKDLKDTNKFRLLIVSAHIRRHSVTDMLLLGILKAIDRTLFEIAVFYTADIVDETTNEIKNLVDHFDDGVKETSQWITKIRELKPDTIYYPEIGMDKVTFHLASLRLSARQIASWGHPITSGLPNIDFFLSGQLIEPQNGQEHYTEKLIELPENGVIPFVRANVEDMSEVGRMYAAGGANVPIFIIPHSDFKLHPQYDGTYIEIARRLGACRFVFFRDPAFSWRFDKTMARLRACFADTNLDFDAYVYCAPWCNGAQFSGFMSVASVYLDPIAFSGFTTAWQAVRYSLPIVTLDGDSMRQRLASGVLRALGLVDMPVQNVEAYIDLAVKLAANPIDHHQTSMRIRDAWNSYTPSAEIVRAFEQTLLQSVHHES